MHATQILDYLAQNEAVLTGSHFVYAKDGHGPCYINMRAVAHDSSFMSDLGLELAASISPYEVDLVIGPETLGRTLAGYSGQHSGLPGIWCDMPEEDGNKWAEFSPKLDFGRLVSGTRVAIVDDLLTTGSSIKLVSELIAAHGGEVVVCAAVVRRTPEVTAEDCGAPALEVLADIPGFELFADQAACEANGPCSLQVPVRLRPGHGWRWIESNPDYPVAG